MEQLSLCQLYRLIKAFDSIHKETLCYILRHYRIPSKIVNIIKNTKHMRMNHHSDGPIILHQKIVEEVLEFAYLGSKKNTDGDSK